MVPRQSRQAANDSLMSWGKRAALLSNRSTVAVSWADLTFSAEASMGKARSIPKPFSSSSITGSAFLETLVFHHGKLNTYICI